MSTSLRALAFTTALVACSAARAADVALQLDTATVSQCVCSSFYYCYYYDLDCSAPVARQLTPAPPQGGGHIDLDATGVLIGGSLSLEAHSEDGVAMPAWSRPVARRDPLLRAHFLAFTGWSDAELDVTSFSSQRAFAGRIVNAYSVSTGLDSEDRIVETYTFQTVAGASAPACEGERLHFDEDADGEEDARDLARFGSTDPAFGSRVDGWGRSIADFCSLPVSASACARSDFRNDEPLRKKPRDCGRAGLTCRAAGLQPPESMPPFAGPTCQGLPLFADADLDSEADATDPCPSTAAGTPVDEYGCSRGQFCALQARSSCRRADFANDEPLRKKPGDCARVQTQCVEASP